jgi:hypothetical protein
MNHSFVFALYRKHIHNLIQRIPLTWMLIFNLLSDKCWAMYLIVDAPWTPRCFYRKPKIVQHILCWNERTHCIHITTGTQRHSLIHVLMMYHTELGIFTHINLNICTCTTIFWCHLKWVSLLMAALSPANLSNSNYHIHADCLKETEINHKHVVLLTSPPVLIANLARGLLEAEQILNN